MAHHEDQNVIERRETPDAKKTHTSPVITQRSPYSFPATLLLCLLFGVFGAHRFFVGKIGTGLLMIVTLGGLGIWAVVDLIVIIFSNFRDKDGRLIKPES